jgi:hypothetical protein
MLVRAAHFEHVRGMHAAAQSVPYAGPSTILLSVNKYYALALLFPFSSKVEKRCQVCSVPGRSS